MSYNGAPYGYSGSSYGYAPGGFSGILDRLTTQPHVAYSPTQRLNRRRTGPLIIVRKSSDGTTYDVYGRGPNGTILASDLTAIAAGGSLTLQTIYDQMGTGLNCTQGTNTLQPLLVESGVACVDAAGNVVPKFVAASSLRMAVGSSTASFNYLHTTGGTVVGVSKANDTAAANKTLIANNIAVTSAGFQVRRDVNENAIVTAGRLNVASVATDGTSVSAIKTITAKTAMGCFVHVIDPDNATAALRELSWENGDALSGSNAEAGTPFIEDASGNLTIGSRSNGSAAFDGQIGSVILFNTPSLPTAERQLLENYLINLQGIT